MRIPDKDYTIETFLEYIGNNPKKVFGAEDSRKWLKVYLVYSQDEWKELFAGLNLKRMGEVYQVVIPTKKGRRVVSKDSVTFYVYELRRGLLMFFSASRERDYEQSLKHFIDTKIGLTEMWITPESFDQIKNHLLVNYDATIYRFIGRRNLNATIPAEIRPEFSRRISYSGNDATQALKEFRTRYGVSPVSIDFRMGSVTLQVTNDGLFLLRGVSMRALWMTLETIDLIIVKQLTISETSKKFQSHTELVKVGEREFALPGVTAGVIRLPQVVLNSQSIEQFLRYQEEWEQELGDEQGPIEFYFINTLVEEEPLSFSTIAVDKLKGTVFGVSGGVNELVVVPKHRTTFESFISFYRLISELLDSQAYLTPFSETIAR